MLKKMTIIFLLLAVMFSFSACSLLNSETEPGAQPDDAAVQPEAAAEPAPSADVPAAVQPEAVQPEGGKTVKATLYFPADGGVLKAEERELQVFGGAIVKATVQALISGPRTEGLHSAIPEGTALNGVNIKEKVAIVDFTKEFIPESAAAGEAERLAIVNTLTEITGVEKVRIRIDGKELTGPDGIALGDISPVELDENGFPAADGG